MRKLKKSFTLIELLIVVAIIGILAGIGIPMYSGYVQQSKIASVESNFDEFIKFMKVKMISCEISDTCLLYTSPSPRDLSTSRMPSSA